MKHKTTKFVFGDREYDISVRTHVMAILNITPDSFSDGGRFSSVERAVARALLMEDEGADFIDIGGESSRPGANPVPVEEEIQRVEPVIRQLSTRLSIPISIDTYKAAVANAALQAGAVMVNDISGLRHDATMAQVAARHGATVIVMHMQGTPRNMQDAPSYGDVVETVKEFLSRQAAHAAANGITQIMVDPGIGFGKTLEHNLALIRNLDALTDLGYPILVGPSRKSFIGTLLDAPVDERLEGTAAAVTACVLNGASVVRVHDVKEMKRVAVVADAIRRGTSP